MLLRLREGRTAPLQTLARGAAIGRVTAIG